MSEETRCRHIGYSFRLAARVPLYASSHRQDNTYHGLCYTSRGALTGTRNSSMGPPHEGSIRGPIYRTMSERSYHGATSHSSFLSESITSRLTTRYNHWFLGSCRRLLQRYSMSAWNKLYHIIREQHWILQTRRLAIEHSACKVNKMKEFKLTSISHCMYSEYEMKEFKLTSISHCM